MINITRLIISHIETRTFICKPNFISIQRILQFECFFPFHTIFLWFSLLSFYYQDNLGLGLLLSGKLCLPEDYQIMDTVSLPLCTTLTIITTTLQTTHSRRMFNLTRYLISSSSYMIYLCILVYTGRLVINNRAITS